MEKLRLSLRTVTIVMIYCLSFSVLGEVGSKRISVLSFRQWIAEQESQIYREVVFFGNKIIALESGQARRQAVLDSPTSKRREIYGRSDRALHPKLQEALERLGEVRGLTVEDYVQVYLSRKSLSRIDLERIAAEMSPTQVVYLLQGYLGFFSQEKLKHKGKGRFVQRKLPHLPSGSLGL